MPLTRSVRRSRQARLAATALWLQRKSAEQQLSLERPKFSAHKDQDLPPALQHDPDDSGADDVSSNHSDDEQQLFREDTLERNAARQLLFERPKFSAHKDQVPDQEPPALQHCPANSESDDDGDSDHDGLDDVHIDRSERDFVVNAQSMSRDTVRDALYNLARVGLVRQSVPGDGYVDTHPTLYVDTHPLTFVSPHTHTHSGVQCVFSVCVC
jgi:hypothetical protein